MRDPQRAKQREPDKSRLVTWISILETKSVSWWLPRQPAMNTERLPCRERARASEREREGGEKGEGERDYCEPPREIWVPRS